MKQFFFLLVFLLLLQNLQALDIQITGKEAGFDFRGEYNRALLFLMDFSAFGVMELNDRYTVKGGLSLGNMEDGVDIKTFTKGGIGPLFGTPLRFDLAYIYNGLPAYETHTHTLLPVASFNGRWAGIAIGTGLRFTRFFGEPSFFESMLSFSVYVNFIDKEKLRIGMSWANFNDFFAGTMGSYSLGLNSAVTLNEQWSLANDIELLQSGGGTLAANFYGIVYRGGVRFTW